MTRRFDAPRALIWRAFTEPRHVARWFGPASRGIRRTEVRELDARPGGSWRFELLSANGQVFTFHGEYRDVVEPMLLVWTFASEDSGDDCALVETRIFEEDSDATRYTSISRFDTVSERDAMLASGMEAGAREVMDQLAALLEELKSA